MPEWIPEKAWADFIDMRIKKKKAPTDKAVALIVAELSRIRDQGQSVEAVLNKSTVNSWSDVFPLKGQIGNGAKTQAQLDQENEAAYAMLFGKTQGAIDA